MDMMVPFAPNEEDDDSIFALINQETIMLNPCKVRSLHHPHEEANPEHATWVLLPLEGRTSNHPSSYGASMQ